MPAFSKAIRDLEPSVLVGLDRDGRDDREGRCLDHVGRIEAPAQADLEEERIGGLAREGKKGGGGGDLEESDGLARVGPLALLEKGRETVLVDDAVG